MSQAAGLLEERVEETPEPTTPREFDCPRCLARCTEGTDALEYGHQPGCPRRSTELPGTKKAYHVLDSIDDSRPTRSALANGVTTGTICRASELHARGTQYVQVVDVLEATVEEVAADAVFHAATWESFDPGAPVLRIIWHDDLPTIVEDDLDEARLAEYRQQARTRAAHADVDVLVCPAEAVTPLAPLHPTTGGVSR